ncbi:hypothetical protein [Cellulosimicrobium phage DS1]|nr:hypothetical protein [Cellulosimicrobium phage DS1]
MSTETVKNAEVETEEVIDKSEFASLDGVLSIRKALADDLAKVAEERKSVTSGKDEVIQKALNESDDPVLVKWRQDRDALAEKQKKAAEQQSEWAEMARKHAESLLPEVDESKVESLRETYLGLKKKVTSMDVTLETLLGSPEAVTRAKKAYEIVDVTSTVRGNRTTSTGEEIIRKRLSAASIDGEAVADKKGKVTFTTLAADKRLAGITGDDLRNQAAKAHGVESVKDIPAETTVEFSVTVGDKTHKVSITTA